MDLVQEIVDGILNQTEEKQEPAPAPASALAPDSAPAAIAPSTESVDSA